MNTTKRKAGERLNAGDAAYVGADGKVYWTESFPEVEAIMKHKPKPLECPDAERLGGACERYYAGTMTYKRLVESIGCTNSIGWRLNGVYSEGDDKPIVLRWIKRRIIDIHDVGLDAVWKDCY